VRCIVSPDHASNKNYSPIAIVGLASLFPGSVNKKGFWRDIISGKDLITEIPEDHWLIKDYYDPDPSTPDKTYCKRGAFLDPINFSPMEFGIPPTNIPSTDSTQLLALIVVKQLLQDLAKNRKNGQDSSEVISVILGVTSAQELLQYMTSRLQRPIWEEALRRHQFDATTIDSIVNTISSLYVPWTESTFPGILGNVVAGRICNRFNFQGTNCVVDAACASCLAALSMAINELQLGQSDMVVCGGADTLNDIFMYMCFSKTPALSMTGDCRPFSSDADGTLLGEGLGFLALKRLEDAERNGDKIYAVIKGLGASSDGKSKSVYAPLASGQARAIVTAYEQAHFSPSTVSLLEAHGTATMAGDIAEFTGLKAAFHQFSDVTEKQFCALGSIKSQIGHTKAAAGAASLIKTVLALNNKTLPPTIKVTQPHPSLDLDNSPFYLNTQARPWIHNNKHPRRAGVSSFGFGGSNFHVALEEYTGNNRAKRTHAFSNHLVIFTARDTHELISQLDTLATKIEQLTGVDNLARLTQKDYNSTFSIRAALIVTDEDDLSLKIKQLKTYLQDPASQSLPEGIFYANQSIDGKVAFIFPGSGSHYVGMTRSLATHFEDAFDIWNHAVARNPTLINIVNQVFPQSIFNENDLAIHEQQLNQVNYCEPAIILANQVYLRLLLLLGLKADMTAGHSFGELNSLHYAGIINSDALFDLALRHSEASVTNEPELQQEKVVTNYLLNIELSRSQLPVYSNKTAQPYPVDVTLLKQRVLEQENKSLPLSTTINQMYVDGAQIFVEVGPKSVLSHLFSHTVTDKNSVFISLDGNNEDQICGFWHAIAQLFVYGQNPKFQELWKEHEEPEEAFSEKSKQTFHIKLSGTSYGRPYPACILNSSEKSEPLSMSMNQVQQQCINTDHLTRDDMMNKNEQIPNQKGNNETQDLKQMLQEALNRFQMQTEHFHQEFLQIMQTENEELKNYLLRLEEQLNTTHKAEERFKPSAEKVNHHEEMPSTPRFGVAPETMAPPPEMPVFDEASSAQEHGTSVMKNTLITPQSPESIIADQAIDVRENPLFTTMLAIVSEKTGYPVEMIDINMNLEADLGIDSIKRVEILSAIRDQIPDMPEIDPTVMSNLQSIKEIANYLRNLFTQKTNSHAQTIFESPTSIQTENKITESNTANVDPKMQQAMLTIVSEKTGYPEEMIDINMNLEADLGIDSIKRVEILSAFREQFSDFPEIDPSELTSLNTLAEIVNYLSNKTIQEEASPPHAVAISEVKITQTPWRREGYSESKK
jgi:acyl transferase domain-containing protein